MIRYPTDGPPPFDSFACACAAVAVAVVAAVVLDYYNRLPSWWSSSAAVRNRWREWDVPFARPLPLFGDTFRMTVGLENGAAAFERVYRRYPDAAACGFHQMRTPYLMVRDPALINALLIADFEFFTDHGFDVDPSGPLAGSLFFTNGRRWRVMRQKLSPGFTSGKLKAMHGQVRECGALLADHVRERLDAADRLNVTDAVSKYATDVIGTCAFGLRLDSIRDGDSEFLRYSRLLFAPSYRMLFVQMLRMLCPGLSGRLKVSENSPEALAFFTAVFRQVVEYRETSGVDRNDVMQTLMRARQELVFDNRELYAEENFTEMDIIGNAVIMFVAGADPVAETLSFCLYELAMNKQIQDKLRQHIHDTKAKHHGDFSNDYLIDLHYADMVILETLRKCSGITVLFRIATQDYHVPNHSLIIEKGQKIIIPSYSIHHDPKYYPNPEVFDPERFSPKEKAKRPRGTDLFFGDGPRFCVGKRLAELEMKLGLSEIISKFEVLPCEKTEIPLKLAKGILVKPKNGIWLRFKPIIVA